MKILWICNFSNPQVRERLHFSDYALENHLRHMLRMSKLKRSDFAAWITNGIVEFEKIKDIELHIISPHYGMKYNAEQFELNGIFYYFFKPDDDSLLKKVVKVGLNRTNGGFKRSRKIVKNLIKKINPDFIHLFGAENPTNSITALDIDATKTPFLVTLQTLMSDPEFLTKQPISLSEYQFRSDLEKRILGKVNYISSEITKYREFVWENINEKAIFTNNTLALAEYITLLEVEKTFDFVYFAASIEKAADVAIEVFALACKSIPSLTLNIIGGSSSSFRRQLTDRIAELKIEENIVFSGRLTTHHEVLKQIQLSKYALLPLKIDYVSGTIREAMFSELPVVTTRTYGTPILNQNRESVLISEQGDYNAMACNIIKLVESPKLAQKLRNNGLITVNELWNNYKIMREQVETYQSIFDHFYFNKPIPAEIATSNPRLNEIR